MSAKFVMSLPLLANPGDYDNGKPVSVAKWSKQKLGERLSVLCIPQASLVSKAKNKTSLQYHAQARKADSIRLYYRFVAQLRELAKTSCAPPEVAKAAKAARKAKAKAAKAKAKAANAAGAQTTAPAGGDASNNDVVAGAGSGAGSGAGAGTGAGDQTSSSFAIADPVDDSNPLPRVCAGVFGNRQGLELSTEGPMTHMFLV